MFEFLTSNWEIILGIVGGLLVVAAGVAKLTPTPKDNEIVEKLQGWFDKVRPSNKEASK